MKKGFFKLFIKKRIKKGKKIKQYFKPLQPIKIEILKFCIGSLNIFLSK